MSGSLKSKSSLNSIQDQAISKLAKEITEVASAKSIHTKPSVDSFASWANRNTNFSFHSLGLDIGRSTAQNKISEEREREVLPNLLHPNDPVLDPFNPQFSAAEWTRMLLAIRKMDNGDDFVPKTAGVAFENLTAEGKITGNQYQGTVGNTLLRIGEQIRNLVGTKRKSSKKQILRNFNGVLEQGEMCIVLGRPGR